MKDVKPELRPFNSADQELYDYLQDMLHGPAEPVSCVPLRAVPAPADVTVEDVPPVPVPDKKTPAQQPPAPLLRPVAPVSIARAVEVEPALATRATITSLLPPTLLSPTVTTVPVAAPTPAPVTDFQPEEPLAEAHPVTETQQPPRVIEQQTEATATQPWPNGRPVWASSRFECLIFNVAGLKLAVPLISLGAVHEIDRRFNHLPRQHDWFIGILQTPAAGNIKVLDTARCIMPDHYNAANRDGLQYVITLHGYEWGLACHGVEQSIVLEPEQVKWRTSLGNRPWLAGTVVEHMCSLIDTEGFHQFIAQAEQKIP